MLAVRMTLDARSQMRCAIFVACSTEQHPMMIARIVVFTVARAIETRAGDACNQLGTG
jgi:hypothetical protein